MNFAGFLLLTSGYSFFFAWLCEVSGRRPLAAIWAHGLANTFIAPTPVIRTEPGASQPRYWIWVSLVFVAGIIFMALRMRGSREASSPNLIAL
jgi:hypothetical protein